MDFNAVALRLAEMAATDGFAYGFGFVLVFSLLCFVCDLPMGLYRVAWEIKTKRDCIARHYGEMVGTCDYTPCHVKRCPCAETCHFYERRATLFQYIRYYVINRRSAKQP